MYEIQTPSLLKHFIGSQTLHFFAQYNVNKLFKHRFGILGMLNVSLSWLVWSITSPDTMWQRQKTLWILNLPEINNMFFFFKNHPSNLSYDQLKQTEK